MTLNIEFSARPDRWSYYHAALVSAFKTAGLTVNLQQRHSPETVDYIIYAPQAGAEFDFTPYTRLRAVLGLWAGVEHIVSNPTLQVPMTRMADTGLAEGMVEWVTGHVLRYHLGMDAHITQQNGVWNPVCPPLARNRRVGVMGLGALGQTCATTLSALNFQVSGWSRSPKSIPGIECHNGADGLHAVLKTSEILVLLLPLTEATENTLDAISLAMLPRGARLLNPGRGGLIDDDDLLAALATGHIAHATLDVFRTEPLPKDHPYWAHPQVTVTPHIASETRADTSAMFIAENIRLDQAGDDMKAVVDRISGY